MIDRPLTLPSGARLNNRIVKSAMSEALADARNDPTEGMIALYRRWGQSGAALLITGNTPVERNHLEHAANVVLDERSNLEKTRRLAVAAKSGGALALVQIAHSGRQTPAAINARPLSISDRALDLPGYGTPKIASEDALQAIIARFAATARLAREAGFDGVEVHGAHGYLLSSALSPRINTRKDRWGGSLVNRSRLLREVIRAVRAAGGADFVVAAKLNSSDFQKGGFTHEESIETARMLEREGVDLLEISGGTFETPVAYQHATQKQSTAAREAYFLDYARDIKRALGIPVMVTGGFRSAAVMRQALAEDATDLIGMGRPFILDPAFPRKLLAGDIAVTPAPERDFPPAEALPRGAVLNWFCHQLALQGTRGKADPDLPVIEGHDRYLDRIASSTAGLLAARAAAPC
ncbi:NADH:flavin oxidoreductase/NADH oxidase family protein [Pelagibius sp.]|uniref:NADH:flavin oxidoreductase/NADH oxidase family protein n=1 Tax=Pelagibius sp. TaxID=1931238 RepID=UPI002614EADE|nr:NADH:flavin oxidoreductase/NADH oxidase family protein [Pelagibius sp.]